MADIVSSKKDMELSDITKPFAFDKYFDELIKSSCTLNKFKKKRKVITTTTTNTSHQSHQRNGHPKRSSNKLSTSQMMEKASSCFICGQQFDFNELNEHEKTCLESIKANDVQYTRQNTEEQASSISSRPESLSLSNHSASSSDSYEKRYLRCYICGSDVPTYLKGIHEKACKKNWESGLLNVDRKTNVRADMFRSLSRSSSKSEINTEQPKSGGLRKAKSSTLYRRASCNNALSVSNDDLRATKNSKSTTNLSKSQTSLIDGVATNFSLNKRDVSTSHTEISKDLDMYLDLNCTKNTPIRNCNSVTNLKLNTTTTTVATRGTKMSSTNKAKSLQDLRKKDRAVSPASPRSPRSAASPTPPTSPRSLISPNDKQKGNSNNPQYVVCHLCGKLYSQHSIVIHVKQCEKTRAMQISMGTNVDYKIKSRSLADLSKGKPNTSRINKISNSMTPVNRNERPSTTPRSYDRSKRNASISSSMDNLSFVNKKDQNIATEAKRNNLKDHQNALSNHQNALSTNHQNAVSNHQSALSNHQNALSTPGLQKCYLCGQLYGTRSLPIHQKQCYIKQERLREQEGQSKKKKKRDIKLMPFGRSNFSDSPSPSGLENRSNSISTPSSRSFSVEDGMRRKGSQLQKSKNNKKETNGDIDVRSPSSSLSSETDCQSPHSPASPISFKDMMMTCVHCGCQCEPYTMAIHEKVCRKITLQDGRSSCPEIRIDNTSCGSNNMEEKLTNGGLIHCEGCSGEFFSSEIFQHRINCRTSTL